MQNYSLCTTHPFDQSPACSLVAVGDAADMAIYGPPGYPDLEPGWYLISTDEGIQSDGPVGPFVAPWAALRWAMRTLGAINADSWGVPCEASVTPGVRWDW